MVYMGTVLFPFFSNLSILYLVFFFKQNIFVLFLVIIVHFVVLYIVVKQWRTTSSVS